FLLHTAPTAIYPLSLHDALPISLRPYLLNELRRSLTACRACSTASLIAVRSVLIAVRVDLITGRSCLRAPLTPFAAARSAFSRADRKSTRLNSSHRTISYAVFCL